MQSLIAVIQSGEPTCAGDDDVHLSDDFVELHQPEAVHAAAGFK